MLSTGEDMLVFQRLSALAWRPHGRRNLRRKLPCWLRDQSGVAAIEFAIVGPLFFLVLLGILIFAMYFGTVHSVQQLAAEAARASIQGLTESERATLAQNQVNAIVGSYPLIDRNYLTVSAATSTSDANLFNVSVRYDASRSVIFAFEGLIPLPSKTIARSAVVRRGGY